MPIGNPSLENRCWRYTVERLDHDEGMIRLEIVPLKISVQEFEKNLAAMDKGEKEKKDELSWWDMDKEESHVLPLNVFRKKLHLTRGAELFEGMVFWVFKKDLEFGPVIHATPFARALSKDLYSHLISSETKAEDEGSGPGGGNV